MNVMPIMSNQNCKKQHFIMNNKVDAVSFGGGVIRAREAKALLHGDTTSIPTIIERAMKLLKKAKRKLHGNYTDIMGDKVGSASVGSNYKAYANRSKFPDSFATSTELRGKGGDRVVFHHNNTPQGIRFVIETPSVIIGKMTDGSIHVAKIDPRRWDIKYPELKSRKINPSQSMYQ